MYDFHSHLGKTRSGEENSAAQMVRELERFGISRVGICSMSQYSMQDNNNGIAEAMRQFPDFVQGIAFIDPKAPDAFAEIRRCLGDLKMNGVKFMPWKHGYNPENCPPIPAVLDAIGQYGVHVQIHGGASPLCTPFVWIRYARERPSMRFVFTHICGREFGLSAIEAVAGMENVWVETSANMEVEILQKAVRELGASRIVFGADWPYKPANIEIEKLHLLGLNTAELEQVFFRNAAFLWDLPEQ